MELTELQGIGPVRAESLRAMGIYSLRDLLYTLPIRYEDRLTEYSCSVKNPGNIMIRGSFIEPLKTSFFRGVSRITGTFSDHTGRYSEDESNILARIDRSLFGYEHLYHKSPVDPEGLLGTIPSVAHVLVGFYCGRLIKQREAVADKVLVLFFLGATLSLSGYLLSYGLPLNKRIWSPSYVMVTCGMAASLLALLMTIIDIHGQRRWVTVFHVFGINPLFLYVASEVFAILFSAWGVSEIVYEAIHSVVIHPQSASLCYALSFVAFNFLLGYILYRLHLYIKL